MQLSRIEHKIYEVRGHKVLLDFDLAVLYEVETRALKQAVKRNLRRFPDDFMFSLSEAEIESLVSQNVIPSRSRLGGAAPFAFTEQGVAMLSSVLNSERAVEVNIAIMRTFVVIRQHAWNYKDLYEKLQEMEKNHGREFEAIYQALNLLMEERAAQEEQKNRERIGFRQNHQT